MTHSPEPHVSEGFGPEHRLQRRRDFLRVYDLGNKVYGTHVVVFACPHPENPEAPWRLGLTATRKLGKAVVRNRLRRRAREYFRRRPEHWPRGVDWVVNFKNSAAGTDFAQLARDLDRATDRLLGRLTTAPPSRAPSNSDPAPADRPPRKEG